MKALVSFSVQKAITVFMIVIAVSIFGIVSYTRLTTDLFPNVNIPYAVVVTTYPGATPEDVEADVSMPLENILQTTTNITEVTSISQENFSLIMLEFSPSADMDSVIIEMRENLNMILDSLPDGIGNPMIIRLNPEMLPIMTFSVTYEGKSPQELTDWVETTLRPRVERVAGVASMSVSGGFAEEIRIQLDEDTIADINTAYKAEVNQKIADMDDSDFADFIDFLLTALGATMDPEDFADFVETMPFDDPAAMREMLKLPLLDKDLISSMLMSHNIAFPAGYVELGGSYYLVRVGDAITSIAELENSMILDISLYGQIFMVWNLFIVNEGLDPGLMVDFSEVESTIRLTDIAAVDFAPVNEQMYSKLNGQNAITITLQKSAEYATTDVTEGVNAALAALQADDENIVVTMLLDQGEYINLSTGSVVNNLILGGALALIILFVFLRNLRATFIVGVAIPISLLFAVVLIYLSGITLNIVSLGGLALGIGMLVDNSIVVMENIFRMKKDGASIQEAAITGTTQVAGAITASTLTTIGVFLPIMFIEDFIREIFYQLAMTVIFSLLASLFIALTLVPSIAAKVFKDDEPKRPEKMPWLKQVHTLYEKMLTIAFKARYYVIAAVLALFVASFFIATSRGFEFFPATDEGNVRVSIQVDPDNPVPFDEFVETLDEIHNDLRTFDDVESVGISLGGSGMFAFGVPATDRANINIVLRTDRTLTTVEFADLIAAQFEEDYPGLLMEVRGAQADIDMLVGSGIQIRLQGDNMDDLRVEALRMVELLENVEGLREIDPGFGRETREIKITVDKEAADAAGLSVGMVLGIVANHIRGLSSMGTVRIDNHTYSLYLYGEDDQKRIAFPTIEDIESIPMPTLTPLSLNDIADIVIQPGFASITRVDGVRSLTVNATIATGYNATLVAQDIDEALQTHVMPDGYDYRVLGESEEIRAALETLVLVGALAVLIVFMIMASQFQSLLYPFIIMFTIPLAFTGGFLILFFAGMPVSIIAVIGLIVLSGVVVNNGIVLVDYINQLREKGWALKAAIFEAGKIRLRPIFMTALTTILALSGLALGFGEGSELMQPMAITAIGGLIYATFLTVFIVPLMYYIVTLHARYAIGGLYVLSALASGIVLFINAFWAYGAGALLSAVAATLLIVFVPRTPVEARAQERENLE